MRALLTTAAGAAACCAFVLCTVLLCMVAKDVFDHGRLTVKGDVASLWTTLWALAFVVGAWTGSLIAVARSL